MKSKILKVFVCIFLLFQIQTVLASDNAEVIRIVDGDTIVVEMKDNPKQKVRLIGIDTPETKHPKKPVQYFGKEATEYTKKHLLGKNVRLTYDQVKYDKYNRLLAFVWIDYELFNLKIIRDGYAFAYLKYPFRSDYMDAFRKAQNYAREHKLGLWK